MQIDRKSLDRLLALNDDQLKRVLRGLVAEYGIDPNTVPFERFDMSALRAVLASASDEDIRRLLSGFGAGGNRPGMSK